MLLVIRVIYHCPSLKPIYLKAVPIMRAAFYFVTAETAGNVTAIMRRITTKSI